MYYEERIINGVLHFRGLPNAKFVPMSPEGMTHRIQILEGRIKKLEEHIDNQIWIGLA